ncbi:hypothetical protein Pmani_034163 [Petrolisthes manimaculis]|uniref:Uncharacterized protein n=1 Tax=Petrolisthes manimaculis TaxID=1843537 RepID=A0AAE1TPF4_9EUCA|nr:hypothetical protein Pmani_034163 [Petrolisthes manimaculis]
MPTYRGPESHRGFVKVTFSSVHSFKKALDSNFDNLSLDNHSIRQRDVPPSFIYHARPSASLRSSPRDSSIRVHTRNENYDSPHSGKVSIVYEKTRNHRKRSPESDHNNHRRSEVKTARYSDGRRPELKPVQNPRHNPSTQLSRETTKSSGNRSSPS